MQTPPRYTAILPESDNGPAVYYAGVAPDGAKWTGDAESAQSLGGRREAQQCIRALRRYYKQPRLTIAPMPPSHRAVGHYTGTHEPVGRMPGFPSPYRVV
jgi:hypothetical protein